MLQFPYEKKHKFSGANQYPVSSLLKSLVSTMIFLKLRPFLTKLSTFLPQFMQKWGKNINQFFMEANTYTREKMLLPKTL